MAKMGPVPVVIFYDLETTNFDFIKENRHKDVQIVSIGAVNGKTGEEYHKYMVPTCAISPGASEINKIKKSGDGLTLRGTEVKAGQPKEVLEDFMDWLDRQTMDFLVAHNNYGFDSIVLRNNLKRFGVNRQIRISKNKDSWAFMKKLKREFPELDFQYFRLQHCLKIFSDEENPTVLHDALQDAKDCQLICDRGAKKLGFQDYAKYLASNNRRQE